MQGGSASGASRQDFMGTLAAQPADALLALIDSFRNDPRPGKIDLGVGVYRDLEGRTPVLRSVKAAERRLLDEQQSKSYLGPEGDVGFVEALKPLVFGSRGLGERLSGLQTPGGTGALRLAAELIALATPEARIWVGQPTWPNHLPILRAAGLQVAGYAHLSADAPAPSFETLLAALEQARPGDVALLHGCCHNPTGVDFSLAQWRSLANLMERRGVLPLIDLAYQGLGEGLEEDAAGARLVLDIVGEGLVAYSCDKNFGLYRDRVGALFAISRSGEQAQIVHSNLLALARANWSMPPDHGAAIVRIILEDAGLATDWRGELAVMRQRIREIRTLLAQADPALAPLASQHGMFAMLPIPPRDITRLRAEHGVYMPASGRINLAGLTPETVPIFVTLLGAIR